MSFFVTSQTNATGDLGGLIAADERCQSLAAAVGVENKTWHAYLSVAADVTNGGQPINARDRIGNGPWVNALGAVVANDLTALHGRTGDYTVFVDENGGFINGQWSGSPTPNEHDVLTGSNSDGTLAEGLTCDDWTSADASLSAEVGHSDGLGPGGSTQGTYSSWNAAHANGGCDDTAPMGGAGRLYCFAL